MSTGTLLYHVRVDKPLVPDWLELALEELHAGNLLLQCAWDGRSFLALAAEAQPAARECMHVESVAAAPDEAAWERFTSAVVAGLDAARGRALRVGVWLGDKRTELLLALSAFHGDGRSLELLAEDLFRLYEQVEQERPLSLPAAALTYAAFAAEQQARHGRALGAPPPARQAADACVTLRLPAHAWMAPAQALPGLDVTARELALGALLRALHAWPGRPAGALVLVDDLRASDPRLARTGGPLTCARPLASAVWDDARLGHGVEPLVHALRAHGSAAWPLAAPPEAPAVCIDLAAFRELPWLGGETWHPLGASQVPRQPARASLDLRLASDAEGPRLDIVGGSDTVAAACAWLELRLAVELERLASAARRSADGRRFWTREFHAHAGQPNVELPQRAVPADGITRVACTLAQAAWTQLVERCATDPATLLGAGLGLLLSRLLAREDLVIVLAGAEHAPVPARLELLWSRGFAQAVACVANGRQRATPHAEALVDGWEWTGPVSGPPVVGRPRLDAGCAWLERLPHPAEARARLAELCRQARWADDIDLWLLAAPGSHGPELCLYGSGRFTTEGLQQAARYLEQLLTSAALDVHQPVGDLALASRPAPADVAADELTVFRF